MPALALLRYCPRPTDNPSRPFPAHYIVTIHTVPFPSDYPGPHLPLPFRIDGPTTTSPPQSSTAHLDNPRRITFEPFLSDGPHPDDPDLFDDSVPFRFVLIAPTALPSPCHPCYLVSP